MMLLYKCPVTSSKYKLYPTFLTKPFANTTFMFDPGWMAYRNVNKQTEAFQDSKLGTLKSYDGVGNENIKTTLHNYDLKMPSSTFYGVRKQSKTKFSFSLWNWIRLLGIQLNWEFLYIFKVSDLE